ncbi:MAG: hypothetical protein Kow0025_03510 [Thermodesulfovibrionales bacterium]
MERPVAIARALAAGALALAVALAVSGASAASMRDRMEEIEEAEVLRQVVNRVASAYGGRAAMETVESHYARGRAVLRGEEGTFARYFKRGRRLRVDIRLRGRAEHLALRGAGGLRWTGEGRPAAPATEEAFFEWALLDMPLAIVEGRYRVSYEGRALAGGEEAQVLGLAQAGGPPARVFVHARRGVILRVESGGRAAVFGDYRKMGGVLYPMAMALYEGGRKAREMAVEELVVNPEINEEVFGPP